MAKKSSLFQFTQAQLTAYVKDENSCVKCVPSKMHIGFPPYGLDNFKDSLLAIISKKKIGAYDAESRGIVLDVRNIKLQGTMSMIRYDSPELHLNINANFYVFQPRLGALLTGTVKHISKRHVSALIYNVFNVSIRLNGDFQRKLQVNKEISFRVKNFDLQNVLPYIEGALVGGDESGDSGISGGGGGDSKAGNSKKDEASSSSSDESEDEKVFKSLMVKTESQPRAGKPVSSSSSSSSDESDEETPLPKPLVKQEGVKSEKAVVKKAPSDSSSEESSDDEQEEEKKPVKTVPTPVLVKKEKKAAPPSNKSSSEDSESEEDVPTKKMPPSQFHTPKSMIVKQEKKESSSSDSSSPSSDEEDFKIPMPKATTDVVVKREVTPLRRVKRESVSSASESEGRGKGAVNGVKKKVLQSPVEELVSAPTFPVESKETTKKKKEKVPVPILSVKQEKPEEEKVTNKKKKTKKNSEAPETPVKVKEEETPTKKATKESPAKKLKKLPPPALADSSSSDDDDDDAQFNDSVNLSKSIQMLANQISQEKKKPTATPRKRKSSLAVTAGTPVEKKAKTKAAAAVAVTPKKSLKSNPDIDLSKVFGDDILSSTRLDSASPAPKAKKAKKVKIIE